MTTLDDIGISALAKGRYRDPFAVLGLHTQPCVVHGVGGLKDTVKDNRSGFVFNGSTPTEQATAFVDSVVRAVELKSTHNDAWQKICIRAASARFSWSESAQQTIELLYDNA